MLNTNGSGRSLTHARYVLCVSFLIDQELTKAMAEIAMLTERADALTNQLAISDADRKSLKNQLATLEAAHQEVIHMC